MRNTAEHALDDLRKVIGELETLLTEAAGKVGHEAQTSVRDVQSRLKALWERVGELEAELQERIRHAARAAESSVRDHPWESVAIAAAVGLLIGLAVSRQASRKS